MSIYTLKRQFVKDFKTCMMLIDDTKPARFRVEHVIRKSKNELYRVSVVLRFKDTKLIEATKVVSKYEHMNIFSFGGLLEIDQNRTDIPRSELCELSNSIIEYIKQNL